MQSCSSALCILILLISAFSTAMTSTVQITFSGQSLVLKLDVPDPVEVILFSERATGRSNDPICTVNGSSLQCNHEYTQRVSLLTSALLLREMKPSDSGVYLIRDIKNKEIIHIYTVIIQALAYIDHIKTGQSLVLELDVSDPVEVIFCSERAAGPSRDLICTVNGSSLQCKPEYTQRVSLLTSFLVMREMKPSDSGVYLIRDTKNKEITHIYTVIVQDLAYTVQIMFSGQSLVLKLDVSDPVEVILFSERATGRSNDPICTVNGSSLQCNHEYTQRVSLLTSALLLREMKPSDSGVYIIRDIKNKEIIHIYTVIIQVLNSTVLIKAGESLVMKLDVSDPVEVIYNRTGGQICTVQNGSLNPTAEYTHRVSLLTYVIELREMKPSDSGVYIIRDNNTKQNIHIYAVIVQGLNSTVKKNPGTALLLKLDISDPVEVIYNSRGAAGPSSDPLCTLDGRSLQCKDEYEHRVSLRSELELREMKVSDSGVYIIWDTKNNETIHIYTVIIQESDLANLLSKVKRNDSASLSCFENCTDLVKWFMADKPTDVLAECDQTSCRSVKEGYQMIHDQYLKGNLSLTITEADFSKRGLYTCNCDGKDICDVRLPFKPLRSSVQLNPGEPLVLKIEISDPVEVIYNCTGAVGPSSGQICTVDGRSLQCKPEYKQRTSLTSALELRAVTPSDSGVYTVMDKLNEEAIHTYTVTVGSAGENDKVKGVAVPVWLIVLVAVFVAVIVVLVVVIVQKRRQNQPLQKKHETNRIQMNKLIHNKPEERQSHQDL